MNPQHPSTQSYSTDQPVSDPAHDLYSRQPIAVGLAKSISSLPTGECFVIGLHGPWGDGKTSVLRFVEHELKKSDAVLPVWFNPWRIGGEDGLLFEFFHTLASAGSIATESKFKEVTRAIAKYAKILRPLGPVASFAANCLAPGVTAAFDGTAAVDAAKDWTEQFGEPTVEQQHENLRTELRGLDKKIVVFIDDIDRLAANEVVSLFRLIKACADLPNIIYVLAFDREMVARVLGDRLAEGGPEAGRRYLEKIIQVPVALPPASRRDLDRACLQGVQGILDAASLTLTDPEKIRWYWAYQDGVSRRLRTPRQVAQYLNALRFAVPLLANEVSTVDLLLVEAMRVCYPAAYEVVRTNQEVFIGVPIGEIERRHGGSPQDDLLANAMTSLTTTEANAVERLVEFLFPRYHVSRRGFTLGYGSSKQWTKDKQVSSPAYGPRFFAYAIGSTDVADADLEGIISAAGDDGSSLLRTRLDKQLEPLKQSMLVFKLDERRDSLAPSAAGRIAIALATLSDRFEEPFSLQDRNHAGLLAAEMAVEFCRSIPGAQERIAVAQSVLAESKEQWFAAAFMRDADPAHPSTTRGGTLVGSSDLDTLRATFLGIFAKLLQCGTPMLDLERRWKFEMLFSVARAGGRQTLRERYLDPMRGNGNFAIHMLQCLAQPLARSGEIIPTPGDLEPDDLDTLALLFDLDEWARVTIEQWVPKDRQKEPSEWEAMRPDDRILAQFWFHYRARVAGKSESSSV